MNPLLRICLVAPGRADAEACELVVFNDGPATIWNVAVPINEISLDIFNLDDTHMPPEARWPDVVFERVPPNGSERRHQSWGVSRRKRSSGTCVVAFSADEGGSARSFVTAPFTVRTA